MANKIGGFYYYVVDMTHLSYFDTSDARKNFALLPYWGPVHREDMRKKMEMKGRPGEEPPNVMRHDATFYQMSPLTPMSQQKNVCIRSKKQFARSLTESVEKPARFTGRIFDGKREVVKFHSSACWRLATEDEVKQLELNARKNLDLLDEVFEDNFKINALAENAYNQQMQIMKQAEAALV